MSEEQSQYMSYLKCKMEKSTETALVVGGYALRVEVRARVKNVAVEQRNLWEDAIDDQVLY